MTIKEAQEKILKNIQREMLFEETVRERYEQIELFGGI